jgi:hypothetical protein
MLKQFRSMGGMTPQARTLGGGTSFDGRGNQTYMIESAHVKHNYNTNLGTFAFGGHRGQLPLPVLNEEE